LRIAFLKLPTNKDHPLQWGNRVPAFFVYFFPALYVGHELCDLVRADYQEILTNLEAILGDQ
jgi:hypothetical protein